MKILVIDEFDDFSELEKDVKKVDGSIEIIYAVDSKGKVDESNFNEHIESTDALIVGSFNKEILERGKNLKWVHCTSAGVNRLLFPEFINSDIKLSNASGIHPIPITEHVFGAILSFERKFLDNIKAQMKREWRKNRIEELYGKTIGVVGVGEIGKRVAEIGKAFGGHIIGVKRHVDGGISNVDELYPIEELNKLLVKSDYVVLCLPSTSKTKGMFGIEEFKKMKNNAVIINIGRGDVIKEEELIEALKNKEIGGAGLDVFEEEPLPKESELYNLDNVLITPHCSGSTLVYDARSIKIFCENLRNLLNNEKLKTEVNKKEGY